MDLYKLYSDKTKLYKYDKALNIPMFFFDAFEETEETDFQELRDKEKYIARSAKYAYTYARHYLNRLWPEGEDAIATSASYSYMYAINVVKGPWSKGEDAIATDPKFAWFYANSILKGRFPKGEKAILNSKYETNYNELIKREK